MIIGVIPDIHEPNSDPRAIKHCQAVFKKMNVTRIVCLGDEVDFHAFSKYGTDPDMPSPGSELELAIEGLKKWQRAFPDLEMCGSNHTRRIFSKAAGGQIPRMAMRRIHEILRYPKGWAYHEDGIVINNIYFFHGEGFNGSSWMRAHEKFRMSCVMGHCHSRAGISWSWTKTANHGLVKKMFSMNCGALVNLSSPAFSYARASAEKPVLACAVIDRGNPMLFPILD